MYDNYAGMFPKFSHFNETLNTITHDYITLVIDNVGCPKSFFDKVYRFKAIQKENFIIPSLKMDEKPMHQLIVDKINASNLELDRMLDDITSKINEMKNINMLAIECLLNTNNSKN